MTTHKLKEALKLALDTMKNHTGNYKLNDSEYSQYEKVIGDIEIALTQPDSPAPAATETTMKGLWQVVADTDADIEYWRKKYQNLEKLYDELEQEKVTQRGIYHMLKRENNELHAWVDIKVDKAAAQRNAALEEAAKRLERVFAPEEFNVDEELVWSAAILACADAVRKLKSPQGGNDGTT